MNSRQLQLTYISHAHVAIVHGNLMRSSHHNGESTEVPMLILTFSMQPSCIFLRLVMLILTLLKFDRVSGGLCVSCTAKTLKLVMLIFNIIHDSLMYLVLSQMVHKLKFTWSFPNHSWHFMHFVTDSHGAPKNLYMAISAPFMAFHALCH